MHKSFSQKIFNTNNNNYYNKDIKKENTNTNINANTISKTSHYIIVNQTENNQYIPTKNYTINYTKNNIDNKLCITTNNEEFQIIRRKTIDINNNNLSNNNTIYINKNINDKNENIKSQKIL